ncbi:MAG TPA: hypothetical protein VMV70_05635 [Gallionella sp.]|nr:hypothetical protein [Gallionella sp.]
MRCAGTGMMAGCGVARGVMVGCALNDMMDRCVVVTGTVGIGAVGIGAVPGAHGMRISGILTGMTTDYGAEVGGGTPGMTAGLAGGG